MTMSCVFCKATTKKYTCCLLNGCKICEACYNDLFVETTHGFAPKDLQCDWLNCPECKKEIVDIIWSDNHGVLKCRRSAYRFVENMYSLFNGPAGLKYSN